MPYEIKADLLAKEIEVAIKKRQRFTDKHDTLVSKFLGESVGDIRAAKANSAMHEYSFVTLHLPKLAFRRPRTRVSSTRPRVFGEWAEAIERALNRIARDQDDEQLSILLAQAFFFSYAVAMVKPSLVDSRTNPDREIWLPTTEMIEPDRFLVDPTFNGHGNPFWNGHLWVMDKDELVAMAEEGGEEDGWVIESVKNLKSETLKQHKEIQGLDLERNEVAGYQAWFPNVQPDDDLGPGEGFNGAVCWMSPGGSGKESENMGTMLRKPSPYYGPPTGPYEMFGYLPVPKSPFFLSPLAATEADTDRLNMVLAETERGIRDYKRMIGLPKGMIDKKNFPSGTTFEVAATAEHYKPQTYDLGGVTTEMLKLEAIARDRLERNSGMDGAQQGRVVGDGTATENAIADAVTQTRSAFQKSRFLSGWAGIQDKRAWFLINDNRAEVDVGREDREEVYLGGDGREFGGDEAEVDRVDADQVADLYRSMEIDIETMSTEATSEPMHKRNIMLVTQMFATWLPSIVQFPSAPWRSWMMAVAEANNVPDLATEFDIDEFLAGAGLPAGPEAKPPSELLPQARNAGRAERSIPLLGSVTGPQAKSPSIGAV